MIVVIGKRNFIRQLLRILNLANKKQVRTHVEGFHQTAREQRRRMLGHIRRTKRSLAFLIAFELIEIRRGAEAEIADVESCLPSDR